MRFGILTQYYPPETGAPQARLADLANRLRERGHEVSVLTAMPNYPLGRTFNGYRGLWRREEISGISVLRAAIYPSKNLGIKRLASYGSFVLSSAALGSLCLPKLDFLMTESPPLFLGVSGYCLSCTRRARWIFNVSDVWPDSAVRLGVVRPGLSLRVASALESFCYRHAWLVSGQSKEILRHIQSRCPDVAMWHLSNGVSPELFSPAGRSAEARERLGGGECIALYAGLHGIAQGLDQVLSAAALLRDDDGFRIVLMGEGPEKERLVRRAREENLTNVTFMDPVPHQRIPALLASSDLALAPLLKYLPGAVPSKIYEAMASAVPVVFVGSGEGAEIIERSGAGLLAPPGDVTELASAMRRLARDPALRRKLGEAGRFAAETQFNRRTILDRFIDRLEADMTLGVTPLSYSTAGGMARLF
jgi:glycosyltransferase involved in cell wall biosynthesis